MSPAAHGNWLFYLVFSNRWQIHLALNLQSHAGIQQSLDSKSRPTKPQGFDFLDDEIKQPSCDDFIQAMGSDFGMRFPNNSRHKQAVERSLESCTRLGVGVDESSDENVFERTEEPGVKRQRIHFLHTSKTGGTFFCECARLNGLNRGQDSEDNCHFLEEDKPTWPVLMHGYKVDFTRPPDTESPHQESAESLAQMYENGSIDVEGNENYLPEFGLVKDFRNIMFLRPPLMRFISIAFMIDRHKLLDMTVDQVIDKYGAMTDNYLTRTLAGRDAYLSRVRTVSEKHYRLAEAMLHNFDDFLVVDKTLSEQVKRRLGWNCNNAKGRESGYPGGTDALIEKLKDQWGEHGWAKLVKLNEFDQKLFDTAQMLKFAGR